VAVTGPQPAHRHPAKKPVRVGLWTAVWVTLAVGALVAVSALNDVKGQPLFDSGLLGTIITASGLFAAAIGPSYIQQRRDTAAIKHEVKNDHTKNFRVENDERHRQILNFQVTFLDEQRRTQAMISNLGREVARVEKKLDIRVDDLRREQQSVQHENHEKFMQQEKRTERLASGLLGFLRGDPIPMTPKEPKDGI